MKTKQGVHIHNLVFEAILGILEFERLKPQKNKREFGSFLHAITQ